MKNPLGPAIVIGIFLSIGVFFLSEPPPQEAAWPLKRIIVVVGFPILYTLAILLLKRREDG